VTPVGRLARAATVLAVAAAPLAAGCATTQSGSGRGTVAACYAFAVQALDRRDTVTSVPPACIGLSHEEINQAVERAIRTVAGPHRKVVARRLAHREAAYLSYLVTVTPPRAQPSPAAAPSRPSSGSPLRLAALAAWGITAAAGAWLLAGWLAHGGLRRRFTRVAGVPRAVVGGHAALALTGLGVWIAFLVTGVTALAWTAVGVVLAVAGLGMATLAGGLPEGADETAASAGPGGAEPASTTLAGSGSAGAGSVTSRSAAVGPAGAGVLSSRMTAIQLPSGKPLALIALHGALAATTILLVVLAAAGAG
jgi:hypothetical protein